MGAGLSIGQGMVVIGQVITAGCGNRLQLMVRQTAAEMITGGPQSSELSSPRHTEKPEHLQYLLR